MIKKYISSEKQEYLPLIENQVNQTDISPQFQGNFDMAYEKLNQVCGKSEI